MTAGVFSGLCAGHSTPAPDIFSPHTQKTAESCGKVEVWRCPNDPK